MPDRLTIVSTIYHQQGQLDATAEECRYERVLSSVDEQPYQRTQLRVATEWQPLLPDKGCWLSSVGLILIENHAGQSPTANMTDEEKILLRERKLEVRFVGDSRFWVILPGESFYGTPSGSMFDLEIRCRNGESRYTVTVFPE